MATEPGRSHYTILGVAPRATSKEIRIAYLNLARALHPDRVRSGSPAEQQLAERRMREVNEAYQVLGDATKRQAYDRTRSTGGPTAGTSSTGRPGAAPPPRPRPRPAGSNPERFDADPAWRDEDGRFGHDPDDDVELSPFVAFVMTRGPLIAVLLLAAFLFVATAYAGGGGDDVPIATTTTSAPCNDAPIGGVTGGSIVVEPC